MSEVAACRSDDRHPCRDFARRPRHVQVRGEPDGASWRPILLRQQGAGRWVTPRRAPVRAHRCAERTHCRERCDHREGAGHLVVGTESSHRRGHSDATAHRRTRDPGDASRTQAPEGGPTKRFARSLQELLDREVNRSIAGHGGKISILDVRDGNLFIAMSGGCQGCAASQVTLRQGFEVMVRRVAPEIVDIVDTTDHASGTKPFYQVRDGASHG